MYADATAQTPHPRRRCSCFHSAAAAPWRTSKTASSSYGAPASMVSARSTQRDDAVAQTWYSSMCCRWISQRALIAPHLCLDVSRLTSRRPPVPLPRIARPQDTRYNSIFIKFQQGEALCLSVLMAVRILPVLSQMLIVFGVHGPTSSSDIRGWHRLVVQPQGQADVHLAPAP